ncbi:phosphoglycerate kinase [Candidatus Saccharibacteria bacterium]|nr:MAG: phosphoglycerate kinase [Candidatus Saccharibacteria bacterium]
MTVGEQKKLFTKRTIRKASLRGTTVLVRADYNVPMADGEIEDDFRIRASVPTLRALLGYGCKIVIVSHLGRPKSADDTACSLEPVARRLEELLEHEVCFVDTCVGPKVRAAVKQAPRVSVTLLENLRFHPEETANDSEFARQLAQDTAARYFVQDGFGVVHRAHASTVAITQCLPSVAGLLLEKEYISIVGAMQHPRRPLVALLGGAKVSDKIQIIDKLVHVADQIVIGGAMANTFLAYHGVSVGASKVEPGQDEAIRAIYDAIAQKVPENLRDNFLILPTDVAVAASMDDTQPRRVVLLDEIDENELALDIGDASIERMVHAIDRAQTVIWNGTLGVAEFAAFAHGSARAALELAERPKTTSIIGGGDTADFVIHWDARGGESFSHVSTGGGASIALMAGEALPGIEALLDE